MWTVSYNLRNSNFVISGNFRIDTKVDTFCGLKHMSLLLLHILAASKSFWKAEMSSELWTVL